MTNRSGHLPRIPASDIAALLAERAESLCRELLPAGHREGAEWTESSRKNGGLGDSLSVHLIGDKAGVWSHFASSHRGDALDLVAYLACAGDKGRAIRWAKSFLGIGDGERPTSVLRTQPDRKKTERSDDSAGRTRAALEIWRAARPAPGTLAEDYLRGRGITIDIPPAIRYHPALKHGPSGQVLPCLIAAVTNANRQVTGIQRIYLTHNGRKAPVDRPKMALGTLRGCAVRLAPTTDRVWLTEGVEDALALAQMMGEPAWALLGAGNFMTVELPENIRQVILAPDGDEKGQGVIREAAIRLAGQGREVRAAKLPAGKDWCDLLGDYEERAGVLQFDGGFPRHKAEALARREVIDG